MKKTKTKTIRVTKQDIEKGRPTSHVSCPVARAIRRACPSLKHIDVGNFFIKADGLSDIVIPKAVNNFIIAFDAREPVKPFTFRIRL